MLAAVSAFFRRRRERKRLALADARALMARFGDSAYHEARSRAHDARQTRIVDANRPENHWDRVRRIIGREIRRDALDTATRYLTSGP